MNWWLCHQMKTEKWLSWWHKHYRKRNNKMILQWARRSPQNCTFTLPDLSRPSTQLQAWLLVLKIPRSTQVWSATRSTWTTSNLPSHSTICGISH
jgi:hypothetical protein